MENEKFSGERFMPEMNDSELEIEHYSRYYAARELIKDLDVLDAACGEGYGSHILAGVAHSVVGVDIDGDVILAAKEKYAANCSNLNYAQGSIDDLSMIEDSSKDVVVSFETIEHVEKKLQEDFLREIKRILKPDGFLIMSTPDKKEYSDRYQFNNEFHVAEFYVDEFTDFLKQEFDHIVMYDQYLEVGSFITRSDVDVDRLLFVKDSAKYNPKGKYVIAIASNSDIKQSNIGTVFMQHEETYLPTLDELNYCRHEAIVCREKASLVDEVMNEKSLLVSELERRAIELDKRMDLINELRDKVSAGENEIKLQAEELERRAIELDNRMNLINELHRKADPDELERRVIELDSRMNLINELRDKVSVGENEIQLQAKELERRAIELDNRMNLINELRDKVSVGENEIKLQAEELERRAIELDNRMNLINELQNELAAKTLELEKKRSVFEKLFGKKEK